MAGQDWRNGESRSAPIRCAVHLDSMTRHLELPVVLIPDEDGGYVVECPVIPGCISQGDTREEALANIKDAIALCLENQAAEGWELPAEVEVTKVAV